MHYKIEKVDQSFPLSFLPVIVASVCHLMSVVLFGLSQSFSQSVGQSTSQSVSQSVSQPVSQSVSQSASQPVSQPASQPDTQAGSLSYYLSVCLTGFTVICLAIVIVLYQQNNLIMLV